MIFQERTYAVLIVSASEKMEAGLRALLPGTDYYPIHSAGSVGQARRMLLETDYDLVLIHTPLRDDFGVQLAVDICADSDAGVLLFVRNELFESVSAKVLPSGVVTLSTPTGSALVSQSLRMLCAQRERLRRMAAKQQSVEEKIEEIRLVNRAKWLLIEREGLSEQEAQHCIERQSMDRRVGKRRAAEEIISALQEKD